MASAPIVSEIFLVRSTSAAVALAESILRTVGSLGRPCRSSESTCSTSEPEKPPCSLVTVTRDAPE